VPHLPALTAACGLPGTETAPLFLLSAYDSVESVFDTQEALREARLEVPSSILGAPIAESLWK
jgi:hypothetical protein